MRDREQRLRWIESLISGGQKDVRRASALVIPTMSGSFAIPFESIVEVVTAARVGSFAFLPPEFCGVLRHGNELVPVIDAGGDVEGKAVHIVLAQGSEHLLGLRFSGTPSVVDLDEVDHTKMKVRFRQELAPGALSVMDVDAVVDALLAMD